MTFCAEIERGLVPNISQKQKPLAAGVRRGVILKNGLKNPLRALALNRSAAPEEEGSEPGQSYEAEGYRTGLRDG